MSGRFFKSTASAVAMAAIVGGAFYGAKEMGAFGPEVKKIRWVLAHEPAKVFLRAAGKFADEVSKETNGQIQVEVLTLSEYAQKYNGGQALQPGQVMSGLADGKFEMSQTYTTILGLKSDKFWVLDLPYLFKDHEHATRVLDGNVGESILVSALDSNIRGLAFTYSGGYRVMPTATREIHTLEDFRGLVVSTSVSPVARATMLTLGAIPVQSNGLGWSSDSMNEGNIDAYETTYVRFDEDLQKKASILNETEHSLFLTGIVINEGFYKGLSPQAQQAIRTAAKSAAVLERQESVADGEKMKAECQKKGIPVVSMSTSEKRRVAAAVSPVYKEFEGEFGKDLIDSIRSLANK